MLYVFTTFAECDKIYNSFTNLRVDNRYSNKTMFKAKVKIIIFIIFYAVCISLKLFYKNKISKVFYKNEIIPFLPS